MNEYLIQKDTLSNIADAIRKKNGTENTYSPAQMVDAIAEITTGVDTSDATATATDIIDGKTAYVNGEKVEGTMQNNGAISTTLNAGESYTVPVGYHNGNGIISSKTLAEMTSDATAAASNIDTGKTAYVNGSKITGTSTKVTPVTPSISVNSGGLITASANGKSATKQLSTSNGGTFYADTDSYTAIEAGKFLTGDVRIGKAATASLDNLDMIYPTYSYNGSSNIITLTHDDITPDAMIVDFVINVNYRSRYDLNFFVYTYGQTYAVSYGDSGIMTDLLFDVVTVHNGYLTFDCSDVYNVKLNNSYANGDALMHILRP